LKNIQRLKALVTNNTETGLKEKEGRPLKTQLDQFGKQPSLDIFVKLLFASKTLYKMLYVTTSEKVAGENPIVKLNFI
jgi:hypothetical protein